VSQQYPGGLITKTPVVPSGPYQDSTASGVWTLDQAAQYVKAGNWPTSGNIDPSLFIENLFSTFLYTGNGSTQTITNGIDLSTKGGLVWVKSRSAATNHFLFDTSRGALNEINSNTTEEQTSLANSLTAFSTSGFALGSAAGINVNAATYVSWTFREQAKFFDVVTYTGTGVARTISHNLGSVPGCFIIKRTDGGGTLWAVYHRSLGATQDIALNSTSAAGSSTLWNNTAPTSSVFSLGTLGAVNASGGTYVAYLFAHDAGGFGLNGTDNVISCGSWTGTGASPGPTITLGWEPQFILYKRASGGTGDWGIHDNMRGLGVGTSSTSGTGNRLEPNTSDVETGASNFANISATGFTITPTVADINASGSTYIYIAIRRGPMKVPTSGTSVYQPLTGQPNGSGLFAHNILTDFSFYHFAAGTQNWGVQDRLRGSPDLSFNSTAAESALVGGNVWSVMTGYINPNPGAGAYDSWAFRRAPGFMDVVCWTGVAGTAQQINHNLSSVPEMIITKRRDAISGWIVYVSSVGATKYLTLHNANAPTTSSLAWNDTTPTSTVFTAGQTVSPTGGTIVAYLFATVAGVSKVGSYTGSGTTKQIDCGFTAGARFVLIKRTDSTGDWYVYDSARGIVAGNDPYALLNSGAANVTSTDYVDTYSAGFELSSTAPAGLNANGGTYIFLAIA
jgi:hypothetical protein